MSAMRLNTQQDNREALYSDWVAYRAKAHSLEASYVLQRSSSSGSSRDTAAADVRIARRSLQADALVNFLRARSADERSIHSYESCSSDCNAVVAAVQKRKKKKFLLISNGQLF
jgi:hypothetical protein